MRALAGCRAGPIRTCAEALLPRGHVPSWPTGRLPSKLAADGVGQLALLAYSDVGLMNQASFLPRDRCAVLGFSSRADAGALPYSWLMRSPCPNLAHAPCAAQVFEVYRYPCAQDLIE
jgi:hypothetical protein